jgi:hypothetical protein
VSKAGKITITVDGSRNQETIQVSTVGAVGKVPVNTIKNKVTYPSRSSAADPVAYWTAILTRAISQL